MVDLPARLAMFGNFGGNEFMTTWCSDAEPLGVLEALWFGESLMKISSTFTLMESFNQLLDKNV